MKTCGFLYVATGAAHLQEAMHSAESVRRLHPELPMVLFTSAQDVEENGETLRAAFGKVEIHPDARFSYRDKIQPFGLSPFDKTLFLDADTELIERVDDVFDLLESYPLACCRDTTRYNLPARGVPAAFSEPNTGVIAFAKTEATQRLFELWLQKYDEGRTRYQAEMRTANGYHDQPSFRESLFELKFPLYVLAEEYNLRVYARWYAGARVRILHAREPYLSRVRHTINRSEDMRYGDGEPALQRSIIELKRWVKTRLLHRLPPFPDKEALNKTYPIHR